MNCFFNYFDDFNDLHAHFNLNTHLFAVLKCSTQDSVMEVGSERPPKGTSKQGRPKGKHQKEVSI